MNIIQSKEAVRTLVEERPHLMDLFKGYTLFCTISPNPKVLIPVLRKVKDKYKMVKISYGLAKQQEQYDYCMAIVKKCYLEFCSSPTVLGTVELNKEGNVHFHLLLKDERITNDVQLQIYRRDILNCEEVMRNFKKKDYMNNIVRLTKTKDQILDYMDKDHLNIKTVFSNYYI